MLAPLATKSTEKGNVLADVGEGADDEAAPAEPKAKDAAKEPAAKEPARRTGSKVRHQRRRCKK